MTYQEYIQKVLASDALSQDTKQKIQALGAIEGSDENVEKIKDLIQSDLEKAYADAGVTLNENDDDVKAINAEMESGLQKVEADLKADMAFVETELKDLEDMAKDVDNTLTESRIGTLKSNLTA